MNKINERYLNAANRIRENYLNTMNEIHANEAIIIKYKNHIQNLMEKNGELIENNPDKDIEQFKIDMKEDLEIIDDNINNIVKKLEPLLKNIEHLNTESKDLFISIKDQYPDLTEENIQEQVFKALKR